VAPVIHPTENRIAMAAHQGGATRAGQFKCDEFTSPLQPGAMDGSSSEGKAERD
jgi:hypothetical protein